MRRVRKARVQVRKFDPWAVLRFSLVFYFCMLLIALLAVALIFTMLKAFGAIDNFEKFMASLQFEVTITGGFLFKWVFLLGLGGVVVASILSVFMAFLYNLIADVVGGIEVQLTERE